MKRFGIKFGDNDFYNTFATMLPIVATSIYNRNRNISKEELVTLLKDCVGTFYLLGQNMYEYNHGYDDNTKEYLKNGISIERVFIDNEINEEVERLGCNINHEFFCCELPSEHNPAEFYLY